MAVRRLFLVGVLALAAGGAGQGAEISVGVYPGMGDEGIVEALDRTEGIESAKLEWYSPERLSALDCVVIPHGRSVSVADEIRPWRAVLRRYVELGGAVVLTHNAVGYRGLFAQDELFGEIETASGRKDAWTFKRVPGFMHQLARKLPGSIRHAYPDHVTMNPGPLGQVICIDDDGDPTVVAGRFGKGRVVAIGALLGWRALVQELKHYDGEAAVPEGGELSLLVESVRWAASSAAFDADEMKGELDNVAEKPAGKPLVVFASNFGSYNLDPNEWIVPPDPAPEQKTWRGHGLGGDVGKVGEVFLPDQPLVARPFKKAPISEQFALRINVARTSMYAGTLDIALTNDEGWGYGVRLVCIGAKDAIDAPNASRAAIHKYNVPVGKQANGIFRIEKGAIAMLAEAPGEQARLRMPATKEYLKDVPVRFERASDGRLTLRVDGRVVAAAQDMMYDQFNRLSLTMATPRGRLAVDDLQLVGFFATIERKEPAPPPVVLPEPKEMKLSGEKFALTDGAQIVVANEEKVATYCLDELTEDIAGYYGVRLAAAVRGSENKALPAVDVGELSEPDAQLGEEGYTIEVTPTSATVRGATERGTFYALQSLFQLISRDGEEVYIRAATIRDWPDLERRGAHMTLIGGTGLRSHLPVLKDQVKMLARLKGNVLIVGSKTLPFPSCLKIPAYACRWTMAQFAEIVRYARAHHIDVWPQVPGLSHSGWLIDTKTMKKRNPEFWTWIKEHKVLGAPEQQDYHYDAFNPGSEEAIDLIFKMGDDVIKATGVRTVFIGMDEIMPPISKMVPGREPADVLAEYINKHHAYLAKQGVRMGMWVDHLLEYGKWEASPGASGSPHYKDVTHQALDRIPKDIILVNWYYATKPKRPAYAYLKSKGFDVAGMPGSCYGNLYESAYYSAVEAKKAGIKGIITFGWSTGHHLNPQMAYILPFIYGWTVPDKMEPDWSMQEVWQYFYQGGVPSHTAEVEPLDIRKAMNESRHDDAPDDGAGWFDYGKAADMSTLAAGALTCKDLRFEIVDEKTTGGKGAVIVATADAKAQVGQKVEGIPVNTKAKSLVFLHIADKGPHSKPIGRYVVHYDDGTTANVPIVYAQNIGPWLYQKGHTSGFYGGFYGHGYLSESRLAYVGATSSGERVALHSYEWVNPNPEKTIQSIDMMTADPGSRKYARNVHIALVALSAVQ